MQCACGCGQDTGDANKKWVAGHWNHVRRVADAAWQRLTQQRAARLAQGMCPWCEQECPVRLGTCHCGCNETTSIVRTADYTRGFPKGAHRKWLTGHHRRVLSNDKVREMRHRYAQDESLTQEQLAEEYGVSQVTVSHIMRWNRRKQAGI